MMSFLGNYDVMGLILQILLIRITTKELGAEYWSVNQAVNHDGELVQMQIIRLQLERHGAIQK